MPLSYPGTGTTFFGRTDERSTTSYAGFGEVTWKITDAWTATAGIRYFTESLEGVQIQTHPFGGFPGSPTLGPSSRSERDLQQGHLEGQFQLQVQ